MKRRLIIAALSIGMLAVLLSSPATAQDSGGPMFLEPQISSTQCKAGGHADDLQPGPQNIENGPCSMVCGSNSSCSLACIDDNENQSDCGDYGSCDPCREGIVEIGRTVVGRSATRKWVTLCEYKTHFNVTYKSVNAGCQPFTVCETEKETHTVPVPCCAIVPGCFGTSC